MPEPATDSRCESSEDRLEDKRRAVSTALRNFNRVIVAFSGGVDSSLLAALARETLGKEHVLAVTADSPSMAREDFADATALAQQLDLQHLTVRTTEGSDPVYQANTRQRCFVCKHELFDELDELAKARGFPVVLYGAIGDDQLSERPGQRAAAQHQVRAPLQDAGLAKWEVRELARRMGLPNWDRPQNACLASRIPHGSAVTPEKLKQIEQAEAFLRAQGFRQVRVRHLGPLARIEVEAEAVKRFEDVTLRERTTAALRSAGFTEVEIAPGGYHPGGANLKTI